MKTKLFLIFIFIVNLNASLLDEAFIEYRQDNKQKAFILFNKSCQQNVLEACYFSALLEYNGDGVNQNKQKAIKEWHTLCGNDEYESCFLLGDLYFKGEKEISQDRQKGIDYYAKSCYGKVANSCYNLALVYYKGIGAKKDDVKARILFAKSCVGGIKEGCRGHRLLSKE